MRLFHRPHDGFHPTCLTRFQAARLLKHIPRLNATDSDPLADACRFARDLQAIEPFNSSCPAGEHRYGIAFTNGGNQTNEPADVCGAGFGVRASVDVAAANYSSPFADDSADSLQVSYG